MTSTIQMRPEDLRRIISRIPRDLAGICRDNNIVIGGGFVRAVIAGEEPSDIDVFGSSSKDQLSALASLLEGTRGDGTRRVETDNAITVLSAGRLPVQFVHRWTFNEPRAVLESFDFTVCQGVLSRMTPERKWFGLVSDDFYPDLAAKRLRYTAPARDEDAGGSMIRVCKYLRRGYHISPDELAKVIARFVIGGKLHDVALRPDLPPEEDFAIKARKLLREVDPLVVLDGDIVELDADHG